MSSPAFRRACVSYKNIPLNSALRKFYRSLPLSCPDSPGPSLFVSKSSIQFFADLFCFPSGGLQFFLERMRLVCRELPDIYGKAVYLFPCFPDLDKPIAPVFFQVPERKTRCLPPLVSRCPVCAAWLAYRELSGVCSPSNLFGFSLHSFCLECTYEKYSNPVKFDR